MVKGGPQNGYHQCLCPQDKLQLPSASPGDSPRSAGGSDPGFFQIIAFSLGPRACEILCTPFRIGVSISHRPLVLPKVSAASLQSQTFVELVLLMQDPWAGEWCGASTSCSLRRTSASVVIFLFVGHPPRGMGVDYITSPPLLPVLLWFLLYIFSWRRSFLLVFQTFSSIFA